MEGWICLQRKFLEWEWYDDALMVKAFLHLLLKANYEPKYWHGILIERGQLITGRSQLANELKISERQVRTILERLKIAQQIDIKTTNRFSLITICNYTKYQDVPDCKRPTNDQRDDQQETNKRPTNDQQTTTTKQYNNITSNSYTPYIPLNETEVVSNHDTTDTFSLVVETATPRKEKSSAKKEKHQYGEYKHVLLTDDEAAKLRERYGDDAMPIVQDYDEYKEMKGYKCKSDYLAILKWGATAYYEHKQRNNGNNGNSARSIQERAARIAEFAFAANGVQNG